MEFFRVYGRVIGLLRAEKGLAIVLAISNVAVAALQFYEPVLFGQVIDLLTTARDKPVDVLWRDAREILGIWALVGLGGIAANMIVSLQADRMAHRRRLGAMAGYFEHLLILPFSFHNAQHSGRLIKIMLTGVDNLFGIWLSFFRENLATLVALFIMLPLSLFMNWRLGLLLLVLILFFAAANVWVVSRTDQLQQKVEDLHSDLAGRAGDALGNIHLIQSFVRLAAETGEMHRIIAQTLQAQFPVLNWWALLSVMTRAASTITVISIFVLGTWLYTKGEATVGEIVSFMGFATMLIGRMDQASGFVSRIFFQMPSLGDFFRVLDAQSTVPDKPDGIDIGRAHGDVEFDDINFSYDGKRPALVHFSLKVPAGATVALVGPTGAGKSTVINLLTRFYEHDSGEISIDGQPVQTLSKPSLRSAIGYVTQESFMFNGTVRENLCIACRGAADEQLWNALEIANAREFVERMPDKLETRVGERGVKLSVGEKQRISIARALLRNPPILLLDEATASVDTETERLIQQALERLMVNRTSFVIAHRLSTVRNADRIFVMEQGCVTEQGTHDELLARGGLYAELCRTAFLETREAEEALAPGA